MSFFDNICRKFESVCEDVDAVVNHDSIKYIERKVQVMGENVMKFYAKLAQIIVTPIMDPEMDEDEDEEVDDYKDEDEVVDDYTTDTQSTIEEITFELSVRNQLDHASVDYEESDLEMDEDEDEEIDEYSTDTQSTVEEITFLLDYESVDYEESAFGSHETIIGMGSNLLPNEAFAIYSNALKSSSSTIALRNNAIGISKWYSAYLRSQIDSYENDYFSIASSMESSITSSGSSSNNCSCETTDLDEESKNLSDQVELEESVIVDYSTSHDDVPCEAKKQPSYKEKILDALSSKKRLAREYKELAILHRDNTTKCFQGTSLTAPPTVPSSDSEWELL